MYLLSLLIISIGLIIIGTAKLKINAFFVLFTVALLTGILAGLPLDKIIVTLKAGFGHTMEKIGLLIILGTALGVVLEKTGTTLKIANYILQHLGQSKSPLAIAVTGFVVGLPVFCDSGFIILSGLKQSLAQKARLNKAMMAAILATSLYSVHCLVPPHPGISAAVGKLSADMGIVMLLGIFLAIPGTVFGYFWAKRQNDVSNFVPQKKEEFLTEKGSSVGFLFIFFPIFLIALKSLVFLSVKNEISQKYFMFQLLAFLGEPIIALSLALLAALFLVKHSQINELNHWLSESIEKAGMVLAIIAAGGVFGEMLMVSNMSETLGEVLKPLHLGIFFPFLITFILKTAQGSSTVAVITAASLVSPMLGELGLDAEWGRILAVLAMGAGSMMISHTNDAYFWVITKFSEISPNDTLRLYSTSTIGMGLISQILIFVLSLILL